MGEDFMNTHPYLRAYMAGIVVPTMFLLIGMTVFSIARFVYDVPIPIERVIVFPMAVVPNLWGVWNILYILLHARYHLPIGFHGAVLPFLLLPLGLVLTRALDVAIITPTLLATAGPAAVIVYYLAWKYLVGFFNQLLGIA
jgi:hypothetical protein